MKPCFAYRRIIDRWFTGPPSGWVWKLVVHHTASCSECRDYYDRLAVIRRAMTGKGEVPAETLDLIGQQVLARSLPSEWHPARLLVAVSCTLAIALVVHRLHPPSLAASSFQARGVGRRAGTSIRLFCLSASETVLSAASSGGTLRCPRSGLVQVGYSSDDAPGRFLAVVGLDDSGHLHWYHAPPEGGASVPLAPGMVDEVLARSVRLSVNHPLGSVRVWPLVSNRPLEAGEIERQVLARDASPSPGEGDPESVLLEVVP